MANQLATIATSSYLALRPPEESNFSLEDLLAATGGEISTNKLTQVVVPSGGSLTWTVPSADGEQDTRELSGIILHMGNARVYYREKSNKRPAGESNRPDCASDDGVTGEGLPGGECKVCPLSQWGSDPEGGRGQACAAKKKVYLLLPDRLLPVVLTLPATSLKQIETYAFDLLQVGKPPFAVETRFALERHELGGNKWSTIQVTKVRDLSNDEIVVAHTLAKRFR